MLRVVENFLTFQVTPSPTRKKLKSWEIRNFQKWFTFWISHFPGHRNPFPLACSIIWQPGKAGWLGGVNISNYPDLKPGESETQKAGNFNSWKPGKFETLKVRNLETQSQKPRNLET